MRKLLSAGFSRLWRDRVFWLCMGTMLAYAVIYMLNGCRQATGSMAEYHHSIDDYYFHFGISIGMFGALFTGMFLGTEYGDGTIRNKIIVGHTRTEIYLANFLLSYAAALLILSVWLIGALVAVPTLGIWEIGISNLLLYLLIAVLFVGAFSAVFTFVGMLSENKAVAVAAVIFLFLALLIFSSMLYNSLGQPEMTQGVEMTANGIQMADPVPNPAYVDGTKRVVYQFILDLLPAGQGMQMWQLGIVHPVCNILSSLGIMAVTLLGGIMIFRKKNIK